MTWSLSVGDGRRAVPPVESGTDVMLGVLPLGTANDLARTLEIPGSLADACAAVADGKVVDIDLGRANGRPIPQRRFRWVVGGCYRGSEPTSQRLRAARLRRRYPARLCSAPAVPGSSRVSGGDHEPMELENLLQVAVGNGRHYGGGNTVSPTAGIDDHTLDTYAILGAPIRDHVKIARLLKDGSFVEHDRVYHLTSRSVRLVTEPPLSVNLDGEIATITPTDFTVQRNAVHVVVPQSSNSALFDGPGAVERPARMSARGPKGLKLS